MHVRNPIGIILKERQKFPRQQPKHPPRVMDHIIKGDVFGSRITLHFISIKHMLKRHCL